MDVGILDQAKDRTGIPRIQSRQVRLIGNARGIPFQSQDQG